MQPRASARRKPESARRVSGPVGGSSPAARAVRARRHRAAGRRARPSMAWATSRATKLPEAGASSRPWSPGSPSHASTEPIRRFTSSKRALVEHVPTPPVATIAPGRDEDRDPVRSRRAGRGPRPRSRRPGVARPQDPGSVGRRTVTTTSSPSLRSAQSEGGDLAAAGGRAGRRLRRRPGRGGPARRPHPVRRAPRRRQRPGLMGVGAPAWSTPPEEEPDRGGAAARCD